MRTTEWPTPSNLRKLIVLLLVCCAVFLQAQPFPSDTTSRVYVLQRSENHLLRGHIQLLADTLTAYTLEDILQTRLQNRFVPFPKKTFDLQSNRAYWGKIQLENRLPDAETGSEWVLILSETFTKVTLYRMSEGGSWMPEANGSFVPEREKKFVPTRSDRKSVV